MKKNPQKKKTVERQPLLERSQEEATALERKIPAQEQQQLQAGTDNFSRLVEAGQYRRAQGRSDYHPWRRRNS
ncbi:alpha/beta hydrolase family protein [Pseudomonas sp. B21-040]|uniref:alpha/beta hydrolase family protein n=1 Tax=Pseudomonas sp. B21-040 TaxID=2895486 RepID=UPI00215EB0F6|nr:alpha/beta hydrolase family protein [Pseudomonas sp. B21-040]UVL39955.1 alpha/beta hydrolase family protein [Pseudomonas sp. B21-040]